MPGSRAGCQKRPGWRSVQLPEQETAAVRAVIGAGTHDPARIAFGKTYAEKIGLPKDAFEVQMLYDNRRDLQEQCRAEGYPVRIYIPYGTHWYPYFMRRLAERPANLWFFISNFFHR